MSALAVAVPLICVPFILRIAGPTNEVGAPFIVPSIAKTPWGKPSTRSLPSPPLPPVPDAPTPPVPPTALNVPVEVSTERDCKTIAPPLPPPPPPPRP